MKEKIKKHINPTPHEDQTHKNKHIKQQISEQINQAPHEGQTHKTNT